MSDKNKVKFGEGVADDIKTAANQEISEMGKMLVKVFSDFLKKRVEGINIDELFSKKNQEGLVKLWSVQLAENGLIPKGYGGLSEELLVDNLHQDGYLDGMYVGYVLSMMALVDNEASKELILTVRDSVRPNLVGKHYNDRDELISNFKDEKYSWINSSDK